MWTQLCLIWLILFLYFFFQALVSVIDLLLMGRSTGLAHGLVGLPHSTHLYNTTVQTHTHTNPILSKLCTFFFCFVLNRATQLTLCFYQSPLLLMECLACNYINYHACCLRIGRHMGERRMKVVERERVRVVEDSRKAKKKHLEKKKCTCAWERERNESGSLINCSFYKVAETCQQCQ